MRNKPDPLAVRAVWAGTMLIGLAITCHWGLAEPQTVRYTYDTASRLVTVVYGTQSAIHYEYDQSGNRTRMIAVGPGNPQADHNTNGVYDLWELIHFGDLNTDLGSDPDNDGLTNTGEAVHWTDPLNPDTDGDGASDGFEVLSGTDPLNPKDYPGLTRGSMFQLR